MKIKENHFLSMQGKTQIRRSDGKIYTIRNNRDRFFFPDEWMVFYDKLKPKQKITFNTLINTGARINEIRNIKVADIDFGRGNIVLRVTKRVIDRPKKGKVGIRKIRVLTVSTKFIKFLRGVIKKYNLKEEDYIPILSTPAANIAMKKTLQRIQIKDWYMFSIHNIRKTHGNWLKAFGIDGAEICLRLGHDYNTFVKSYGSPDIFSFKDMRDMKIILGDVYEKGRR